jgi:SHAQKYF class myb-like DNA-binding protein
VLLSSGHVKAATQNKPQKKRFIWSDQLHAQFVAALFDHGLKTASPRLLLDLMPTPGDLTTEHVKSHLQKYRLHRDKSREDFLHRFAQQLDQGFEKDDTVVQRVCCEEAGSSCRSLPLVHSIAPMKIPQLVCATESDCVDQHRNVLQQHLALISKGIAMQTSFQQQLAQLVNCQLSSHQNLQNHSNLLTNSSSSSSSSGVHNNPPASPTSSEGSVAQLMSSRCCSSNSTASSAAAATAAVADVKPAVARCCDNGDSNSNCNGASVTGPSLSRLQEHRPREEQYEPGAYIRKNTSSSSSNGSGSVISASAVTAAVASSSSSDHMQCDSSSDVTLNVSAIGMISKIAQTLYTGNGQQQQFSIDSEHHSSTNRACGDNLCSSSSNSKAALLASVGAGNSAAHHTHSGTTDRLHAQMCAQMDLVSTNT